MPYEPCRSTGVKNKNPSNILRNDRVRVEGNYKQIVDLKFIRFPLHSESSLPTEPSFAIWDFEALGVSGPRFFQLKDLSERFQLTLLLTQQSLSSFEQQLYESALESFQKNFPKVKINHSSASTLEDRAIEKVSVIFPQTSKELGFSTRKLIKDYLEEVSVATWLTEEWLRFFPLFLKERFPKQIRLFEGAQYEVFKALLDYQDFATQVNTLPDYCFLNPSLQIAQLSEKHEGLGLESGLYALFRSQNGRSIVEKKLDAFSARFIDHLTEFMTMSEADVVNITQKEFGDRGESTEGLEKSFSQLKQVGIILNEANKNLFQGGPV